MTNTATISSTTPDPIPGNNGGTDTDTPLPSADLSVVKTDGSATYTAGTNVSYSLTVNNAGPSDAQTVALSDPLPVTVGSPVANRPRLFVLAIGVSGNQRADLRRTFASADAQAIGSLFANQTNRDFSDTQVRVVTDPLVTRFNLSEGFRWLAQESTPDDTVIVVFAGQALRDQHDKIYFQHQESRFGDPAAGLPEDSLSDHLQHVRGQVLLILDVVERDENAQAVPGLAAPSQKMPGERATCADLIRRLAGEDYGITVLAMTRQVETGPDATVPANSPFARSILDGLAGKADTNSDGVVDMKELVQFVRSDVKQRTNGNQIPMAGLPTLVPNVPIARRTK